MRRFSAAARLLFFIAVFHVHGSVVASPATASVDALVQDKGKMALALSEPAARCVIRDDTRHAAFHGCIDWHSAVHGTWALVAYTAMTGDRRHEPVIQAILTPANLENERILLLRDLKFEMPYGRAWLLRLALEYDRHYQDGKLSALGDIVAKTMMDHYRQHPPEPLSAEYDNSAWALINLLDYYRFRGDADNASAIEKLIRAAFLAKNAKCDSANDRFEFMAKCTNWAWAVSKVASREEFSAWIGKFMPPAKIPTPIGRPGSAHEYGLNFSRAWGLWAISLTVATPEYLRAYVNHMRAGYDHRNNWDGDYRINGHWVAQFGMFAIQPLFGERYR